MIPLPQQPGTTAQTSPEGQSLVRSHSLTVGHIAPVVSRHCLRPPGLRKQKQAGLSRQFGPSGEVSQMGASPLHGPLLLRAWAAGEENKASSAVPKNAPPVSLMALPREMVPEASSLDRSSKEGILSTRRGLRPSSPLQVSSFPNNSGASFLCRGPPGSPILWLTLLTVTRGDESQMNFPTQSEIPSTIA